MNPDFTLVGKYRFSVTEDVGLNLVDAMLEERSIGIAYRPVKHDRFNALARYTRLLDQKGITVDANVANKSISDVFSGDGPCNWEKRLSGLKRTLTRS